GLALEPVFQVYVVAPAAVKFTDAPAQTVGLFTVTVGLATIVTVDTALAVQPAVVPVTVYDVAPGVTLNGLALEPVFQVYVVAPAAVKFTDEPAQAVGLFTVTVGLAT